MNLRCLYVFAISHYCEKARWALDYLGFDYRIKRLAPGAHAVQARKMGLKRSSLPILQVGERSIQGSSAIIDWAEKHSPAGTPTLNLSPVELHEALEIEKRLDEKIGVHIRRMLYSEAVVEFPDAVKSLFTRGQPWFERARLGVIWPMVRKKMIAGMDLGPVQGQESKGIVDEELDWLDALLSDGRRYLVGGRLSRADITAASLLAGLVLPENHPEHKSLVQLPRLQTDIEAWAGRPSLQWVLKMYRRHRYIDESVLH